MRGMIVLGAIVQGPLIRLYKTAAIREDNHSPTELFPALRATQPQGCDTSPVPRPGALR